MTKKTLQLVASLLCIIFIASCASPKESKEEVIQSKTYKIAVSKLNDSEWYVQYKEALLEQDSLLEIQDMYYTSLDSALMMMEDCDGLLLTGGPDIFPGRFGKLADTARCGDIDYKRDTLEFALFQKARQKNIPIFGICRGLQMINVALGGSLIIDIPTDWPDTSIAHRKLLEFKDMHYVYAVDSTRFKELVTLDSAYVNSYHHQGIDRLADQLRIAAYTSDGLPEAVEYKDDFGNFLIGVQYHPERLKGNPYAVPLFKSFVEAVKSSPKE